MSVVKKVFQFVAASLALWMLLTLASAAALSPADLLNNGRLDDAVRDLKVRIQNSPKDAEAYHLLARAYFHLQKWDQSIAFSERAVALAPNNAQYYLWLGRAYGEKAEDSNFITAAGLTKKVRAAFEKAVELDSSNVDAASDLAEFYLEAPGFMGGGTDKARREADRLQHLDAARAHWVNARIFEKKKDNLNAEREYYAAINDSGNDASYWLNLASFYRRVNRIPDMERAIGKATQADKKKSNIFYDAATLFYRTGRNLPAAANLVRKYLTSNAPSEEAPAFQAHYMLGAILEKEGDKQGAAAEYRASLNLASDYKPAQEGLRRVSQ